MVNVTEKFDEYFKSKGMPLWNKGNGFAIPSYFYYEETGEYYQYWPAFCAADASSSWRKFADDFESAIAKLTCQDGYSKISVKL